MKIKLADGTGTINLKYVYPDEDRHGNLRVYVKRDKKALKIRLTADIGTDEFFAQYRGALKGTPPPPLFPAADIPTLPSAEGINDPKSFRWLVSRYVASTDFLSLSAVTQARRRSILEDICDEIIDGVKTGPLPFALMEPKHVRVIRDQKKDFPGAANNRLKALRAVFRWATDETVDHAKTNPTTSVKRLKPKKAGGFHRWTVSEILQYEAHHKVGTVPRLAFDLLLYTITRRSDVVRLGPQMERTVSFRRPDGSRVPVQVIEFTERKNENTNPKRRVMPILAPLRESIDATPSGHLTYLITAYGRPRSAKGFTNWFKEQCADAGLPHCSPHGVRKGGATIAAERGATTKSLQAMGGWLNIEDADIYVKEADRTLLALEFMHLLEPERNGDESFPPQSGVPQSGEISVSKALKNMA